MVDELWSLKGIGSIVGGGGGVWDVVSMVVSIVSTFAGVANNCKYGYPKNNPSD